MAWIESSDTCVAVYGALTTLQQIDDQTTFDDAGPIQMKDLFYYNSTASDSINQAKAGALARVMESTFANAYAADYKGNYDKEKAIDALCAILIQTDKKVEDLSDAADLIYTFP